MIKPAELTSLSALRMAELACEAGLPDGVLNVVPGLGETAGQALGRHPGVDVVTFTGSTEVGRLFLRYSAESNLKRVVLECGGKSPQVVMADAGDLDRVAEDVLTAGYANMGENCTCGSRLIVHRSVHDELLSKLVAGTEQWTVGDPQDPRHQDRTDDRASAPEQGARLHRDGPHRRCLHPHRRSSHADRKRWLLRRANNLRGREELHDDRPRGDLRTRHLDDPLRHRGRGDRPGQRHQLRAGGVAVDARTSTGRCAWPGPSRLAPCR